MEVGVADAAERLGVDRSRVRQLVHSGDLPGRRVGREWLIESSAVARLAERPHPPGRPMAAVRAWGLLDLLDGERAPWLSSVARSQVRRQLRGLAGADAHRWRNLLRRRSKVRPVRALPSLLGQLQTDAAVAVLPAGAGRAVEAGADLIVLDPMPELYLRAGDWPEFATRWALDAGPAHPNLLVRLPAGVDWPFAERGRVGPAALAADLLDDEDPRSAAAGRDMLNAFARRAIRVVDGLRIG